jgi:hypothetical protein
MYIYYVVFNATFSNISAILWQPFLVVEEVSEENYRPYCESSARRGRDRYGIWLYLKLKLYILNYL